MPIGTVPKDFKPTNDAPLTDTALEAVRVSEHRREDKNAPALGSNGRVVYTFGAGLPTIVCARLRVCIIELQAGERMMGEPQIGKYDSRVSYGQDGVQVGWSRIIDPDASSVDLDGMVGLDSHGNLGLRDKLDHHYTRLIGFSALTSMFSAAFPISQRANQSVLACPTPGQAASQAVGQGAEPNRRTNHPSEPECPADDQGSNRIRVRRPCQLRHPLRSSVRTDSERSACGSKSAIEVTKQISCRRV
jgi:hypothetical protein